MIDFFPKIEYTIITKGKEVMSMKKIYVVLRDAVEYEFDPAEYTEEEAKEKALEWWDERMPQMYVCEDDDEEEGKENG